MMKQFIACAGKLLSSFVRQSVVLARDFLVKYIRSYVPCLTSILLDGLIRQI